ncbi:hypothetical protein HK104_002141 [Borealophlyctis nickersoniae]|nr:hypothetical protein HK104_002141 [Borealophlyctis nickersoniae]
MPILIKPPTDVASMVELLEKEVLVERDSAFVLDCLIDAIFLVNNKVPLGARSAQSQQPSTAPPALNTPASSNLPPAYHDVTPVGQQPTTAPSPRSASDPPKPPDVVIILPLASPSEKGDIVDYRERGALEAAQ